MTLPSELFLSLIYFMIMKTSTVIWSTITDYDDSDDDNEDGDDEYDDNDGNGDDNDYDQDSEFNDDMASHLNTRGGYIYSES